MTSPLVITRARVCGQEREFVLSNRKFYELQMKYAGGQGVSEFLQAFDSNLFLCCEAIAVSTADLTTDQVLDDPELNPLTINGLAAQILKRCLGIGDPSPLPQAPDQTGS